MGQSPLIPAPGRKKLPRDATESEVNELMADRGDQFGGKPGGLMHWCTYRIDANLPTWAS